MAWGNMPCTSSSCSRLEEKSKLETLRNTRCKCKSSHSKLNLLRLKQIPSSGKKYKRCFVKNPFHLQGCVSKISSFLLAVNIGEGICTVQSYSNSIKGNPDFKNISFVQETSYAACTVMKDKQGKNWGKYYSGGLLVEICKPKVKVSRAGEFLSGN